MKNKNTLFIIIIAALASALGVSLFFLFSKNATTSPETPAQTETPVMKVMSHVRLKTWTDGGAIVVMDDSSAFSQLNIFIPKEYLDNKYVGGDYLSIYHNGVIKDDTIAQFEHIYSVDTYHIDTVSSYNEWKINDAVNTEHPIFIDDLWPAILQAYTGTEDSIQPVSVLGVSNSYNPIYAILCSINHGDDKYSYSVYYIERTEGQSTVLLSESVLANMERLKAE